MTHTERQALDALKSAYRDMLEDSERRAVYTTDENTRRGRLRVTAHLLGIAWARAERARRMRT